MHKPVGESTGEAIASKRLEVTNLIYEFINDTALMPNLIDGLAQLDQIDPASDDILAKLDNAADLAQRLHATPDIDITRDIGLLVVGIDAKGEIVKAPPGGEQFLGQTFNPGAEGIGWINEEHRTRCFAHYISFGAQNYLPIHQSLIEGLKTKQVTTLIAVYRFELTEGALDALKELYGLTDAEMSLCNSLGQGLTPKEAASQKGVGQETMRTHLKRVFQKMGVNRQTEVVRIVTQIAAAASAYDVSRRSSLDLMTDERNSVCATHTAFMRARNGKKLCYSIYGDPEGEPVLYFHHTLGCRILNESMAKAAYDAGILIYTFDRPGYGDSEAVEGYDASVLAEYIEDFLDAHSISSIRAIALAIGGRSVLDAIPYMQGRIKSLDLYSFRGCSPPYDPKHIWNHFIYLIIKSARFTGPMVRLLKSAFTPKSLVKNMQNAYGSSPSDTKIVSAQQMCFYLINLLQIACKQEGVGPAGEFNNLRTSFEPDQDDYKGTNIRAYYGDEDAFNPYDDARDILAKLPQIEVLEVEGAGQLHLFAHLGQFLEALKN